VTEGILPGDSLAGWYSSVKLSVIDGPGETHCHRNVNPLAVYSAATGGNGVIDHCVPDRNGSPGFQGEVLHSQRSYCTLSLCEKPRGKPEKTDWPNNVATESILERR